MSDIVSNIIHYTSEIVQLIFIVCRNGSIVVQCTVPNTHARSSTRTLNFFSTGGKGMSPLPQGVARIYARKMNSFS